MYVTVVNFDGNNQAIFKTKQGTVVIGMDMIRNTLEDIGRALAEIKIDVPEKPIFYVPYMVLHGEDKKDLVLSARLLQIGLRIPVLTELE